MNHQRVQCIVCDFAFTLCSDLYFKELGSEWVDLITKILFCKPCPLITKKWGSGECSSKEIAQFLSTRLPFSSCEILDALYRGCATLTLNPGVRDFVLQERDKGKKLALVTINMDVFTEIVVQSHRLDTIFDVIVNSADYSYKGQKEMLWNKAFELLGPDYHYSNSFLIEDGQDCPKRFRELGGQAYQYTDDCTFEEWLKTSVNFL
jgi:FMN phosphatase YigB (HAD superfamily)